MLENFLAVRSVHNLGMELHAITTGGAIFESGGGRIGSRRGHHSAGRRDGDRVEVTHPHRLHPRLRCTEQQTVALDGQFRASVFTATALGDLATEIAGEKLRAVTDPQNRNAEVVDTGVDRGRTFDMNGGGATGEDDAGRILGRDLRCRDVMPDNLGEYVRFAHAAGDQLRVLRTEVDDEDRTGFQFSDPCRRPALFAGPCLRSGAPEQP